MITREGWIDIYSFYLTIKRKKSIARNNKNEGREKLNNIFIYSLGF